MDGPLPGFKVILSRQKIQTAVETDKFTKEGQCLTLFATEMVFSKKAVSDLDWKNVAKNQTLLAKLRLKVFS
jgi:hypothetical protein